jgi:hypothetical protein
MSDIRTLDLNLLKALEGCGGRFRASARQFALSRTTVAQFEKGEVDLATAHARHDAGGDCAADACSMKNTSVR